MTLLKGEGTPISRVLVATDLSTRSDRALLRAMNIARPLGATLSLVHVVDGDLPHRVISSERSAALSVLEETVRHLNQADHSATVYKVIVDDAPSGILSAAEDCEADLIVMGPHRRQFRDVFVGTTLERVIRRSRFPMLVAIQPPTVSYERTLVALSFEDSSKAAAQGALCMGVFDKMSVKVMHAFDAPGLGLMKRAGLELEAINEYVEQERTNTIKRLDAFTAELGIPPTPLTVVLREGSPAQSILECADEERSNLIVFGTSAKNGMKRLLIGSVAEQVLREAERDILVIPKSEQPEQQQSA